MLLARCADFLDVLECQHADHRTEDLVGRDSHFIVNVRKDRRLDEEPALANAFSPGVAAVRLWVPRLM